MESCVGIEVVPRAKARIQLSSAELGTESVHLDVGVLLAKSPIVLTSQFDEFAVVLECGPQSLCGGRVLYGEVIYELEVGRVLLDVFCDGVHNGSFLEVSL